MLNHTPVLFIGVGETGAFFTLRETFLHTYTIDKQQYFEVRSFHHFNLSQDPDAAFTKATEAAAAMGMELKTTRETLDQEMRDIQRATAEQIAAREARAKADQEHWQRMREAAQAERLAKIDDGKYPFGPYVDKRFEKATRSYITWLINKREDFEPDSLIRLTADAVAIKVPHLAFPAAGPGFVGEQGERLTLKATVIRCIKHVSDWGVCYIVTMVTPEGICLVSMSSAFCPNEGDELHFKATVKEHSNFRGQDQTKLQRISIIKEKPRAAIAEAVKQPEALASAAA